MDTIIEFTRSFVVFVINPKGFLKDLNLDDANLWKKMAVFLGLGITVTAIMGYVNFRLSPLAHMENIDRLFDDKAINLALILNTAGLLGLGHGVFKLLGTGASFTRSCTGLGFTLAFMWPLTSLVLIVVARIISPLMGVRWIVIPPLTTSPLDQIEPTTLNLLLLAVVVVINIALILYCLFAYYSCFAITHKLPPRLTIAGIVLIAVGFLFLGRYISMFSFWISNLLGPATGHIVELPS